MFGASFIIWVVLAIVTAFMAAKKNRSFIGWLMIGIVFPLIGFIMVLVMREGELLETSTQS
ncbi:MAG: hypothetical protein HOH77_17175 [Candidatus Latescibacteria bacterium]|nr:hypothetical protein [Candidatus Latescibacterota bacterium]